MRWLLAIPLCLAHPCLAAPASDSLQGTTQARVIRDFARVSFEWSRPVLITASSTGNVITIEFERPVAVDAKAAVRSLAPYVKSAALQDGGRRMVLQMQGPYRVRSFVSDQVSGVDILDIKSKPKPQMIAAVPVQAKPKPKAVPVQPPASTAALATQLNTLTPAAALPTPKQKSAPVVPVAEAPVPQVAAPLPEAQAPAAEAPSAEDLKAQALANTPPAEEASKFTPEAFLSGDKLHITYPWKTRVAAAGFKRGRSLYVVFSEAAAVNVNAANLVLQPAATLSQIPSTTGTVLKIDSRPDAGLQFAPVEGGFEWQVSIQSPATKAVQPLPVTTMAQDGLPAHAVVPALESTDAAVNFVDPEVGDNVLVMPVFAAGKGVFPERHFVDFSVLASAQGVVVVPHADAVKLTKVLNGIRIDYGNGANISPDLPAVAAGQSIHARGEDDKLLFPYQEWKLEERKDLREQIASIMREITSDRNATGVVSKYHRAAQLCLAEGMAAEALGLLASVKRLDPQYYIDRRLSAMEAAANFLMNRNSEAFQAMSVQELDGNTEAQMWRALLGELLGTPNQSFDYLANYDDWISKYPPMLRQRLAILAADRAVAAKEFNVALKIFDQLNQEKVIGEVADYVNYLMGMIAVENGQPGDGFKIWLDLIEQPGREFVKARAAYALASQRYSRGMLPALETAEELEKIALRWRGDSLDLNVLTLLSTIYAANKDWPNALRVWRSMNEGFPNTQEAVNALRSMGDAFHALFALGEIGSMSTLDQLFLFHEYRSLLQDNEAGDLIADNVVGKMLALDMLPEATDLLEKRMRVRLERDARSKVGTQLARIYLMSRLPEKALNALQESGFGQNPEALNTERLHLAVQVMLDLRRFDDALRLIADDTSPDAMRLRAEAYWRQKDWAQMVPELERYFKARVTPGSKLAAEDVNPLVYLALGYQALGEYQQLVFMRDYFLPMLPAGNDAKLLAFLTRDLPPVSPSGFDEAMEGLAAVKEFLTSYRLPISPVSGT